MDRAEIARRLHEVVELWETEGLASANTDWHLLLRVTLRSRADPTFALKLVVGTEPADDDE
jgi:hypothetical protein